jgi:hypothetical protein
MAALKQMAAEATQVQPVVQPVPGPVTNLPTTDNRGLTQPSTNNANSGSTTVAPPPVEPAQPKNSHFAMTATLDSTRVVKNIGNLMDEVINHLIQVDGAKVEIKLLVEATMPDGAPVPTVRTVTENCKTLKVDDFGFDS